ncbi:hypothetical protein FRC04_006266 [Tulasnella sp. 424]|nr:hypothetical protein FRC04_006266 [Tulasnella sp. 424]KAG8961060.1 hypothetical protein FRC05_006392 [Tulasnella sp. 425]
MVATRNRKGQSTSNSVTPKAPRPAKPKAKVPKSSTNTQPPKKRVKTASPDVEAGEPASIGDSAAKPVSALQNLLLALPVEIFSEICSFLDAIDLRHLSLTDETFWSVLVSPKSDCIWRQALGRVVPPMPECPKTMSGSEYARFMLVDTCMVRADDFIMQPKTDNARLGLPADIMDSVL